MSGQTEYECNIFFSVMTIEDDIDAFEKCMQVLLWVISTTITMTVVWAVYSIFSIIPSYARRAYEAAPTPTPTVRQRRATPTPPAYEGPPTYDELYPVV